MNETAESITMYQIIKDIIIPGLGVIATIVIGVVLTIILKKREETAKIKSLLIDSYMEYLNRRTKFSEYESLHYIHELLKDIYINYSSYFEDHSNSHLPKKEIEKIIDLFKRKIDGINIDDTNWTVYTFKFCFLLGTKTYNKKAQGLENIIVSEIIEKNSRSNFLSNLKLKVKSDILIKDNINKLNIHCINSGIEMIINFVTYEYTNYQQRIFKPYDNLIADLIDEK